MATTGPKYHPVATGAATETVQQHQEPEDLTLWAGWFCPFTQRAWIALEEKSIPYKYIEVNPYLKDPGFLAISPKGLVPTLTLPDGRPVNDSLIICEYLEDAHPSSSPLLPKDPYERAQARTWIKHINEAVVPAFFRLLQAQPSEQDKQAKALAELNEALRTVCQKVKGPYFFGEEFGLVDVAIAPWAVRDFIVQEYRGFRRDDVPGWGSWAEALESRGSVARTTSEKERYVEFNQTFLKNEGHSMVGKAARSGRAIE
ncbi:glutathione S-transferase [Rhizodiscina lignyota]|uniref:Glutathione S-transferase n=1 Tax=Rhizodiscina lignyota TaxID=1504668 RepID=A0A9P4M4Q2_9PEZI|nr:glutathione S-transferase [Rhizodiscina lignyota]